MRGSVCLGYITGGTVRHEWHVAMQDFILRDAFGAQIIGAQAVCTGPYIADNRNQVVERFLETPCEWLWFTDIDIEFDPTVLDRLLAVADVQERPIVGALYFNQINDTPAGTWWPVWTEEIGASTTRVVTRIELGRTYDLTVTGMGCTIIHRSVFEKLATLVGDDPWKWFGHDLIRGDDGTMRRAGEDATFCYRARAAGFPVTGLAYVVNHTGKNLKVTWDLFCAQFRGHGMEEEHGPLR
jgi:hypothetical protein